jgi:hypothetical protein
MMNFANADAKRAVKPSCWLRPREPGHKRHVTQPPHARLPYSPKADAAALLRLPRPRPVVRTRPTLSANADASRGLKPIYAIGPREPRQSFVESQSADARLPYSLGVSR